MMTIVANPRNYKIPEWFLNRQKDHKTGRFTQASCPCHAQAQMSQQPCILASSLEVSRLFFKSRGGGSGYSLRPGTTALEVECS